MAITRREFIASVAQATGYGAHLQFFEALFVQQSERHVDDLAFMNFHKRYVPVARALRVDYKSPILNHVQGGGGIL